MYIFSSVKSCWTCFGPVTDASFGFILCPNSYHEHCLVRASPLGGCSHLGCRHFFQVTFISTRQESSQLLRANIPPYIIICSYNFYLLRSQQVNELLFFYAIFSRSHSMLFHNFGPKGQFFCAIFLCEFSVRFFCPDLPRHQVEALHSKSTKKSADSRSLSCHFLETKHTWFSYLS